MSHNPLETDAADVAEMGGLVAARIAQFVAGIPDRPVDNVSTPEETADLVRAFLAPPPETGGELKPLLDRLDEATACAVETTGPGFLAAVPGGGLYSSALGEFWARATNRYGSLAVAAPALAALEESTVQWMARDVCGLPEGSGGLLTTGGSMANFSALVAARHDRLGEDIGEGTVYTTPHAHHSVAKAALLAGIKARNIRSVPCDGRLGMDVPATEAMVRADRAAGRRPFLVVGSAGTTDTGTIDPLAAIADLARREGLWFHADAAYGGFFRLTERGRAALTGLERADSVTLDPHKALFLPFGTGALVVRDPRTLRAAFSGTGTYLQDVGSYDGLPDYADMGVELSHEVRGLRLWLPLHLHGVAAFRAALDEKLDLARHVHDRLSAIPALELPLRPELSTVVFRVRPHDTTRAAAEQADRATRRLLEGVNAGRRVLLQSTVIDGRQTVRVCVVSYRTHRDRIDELLDLVTAEAGKAAFDGATPES
ncbi:aminotransferase class V-fold PLP-dependent enzyme [Streptomyces sp. NPDC046977]|uniref:pyridoxal phosphate-dependent decarboxylase family protein n=1 Tax=Streptomyces sp. NPDC046977 TaxID=3154703 RepID=UPI0033E5BA68